MKNTILLLCVSLTVLTNGHTCGQVPTLPAHAVLPAKFGPHQWTATVKVIGEDGNPIAGVNVSAQYDVPTPPDSDQPTYGEVRGVTDDSGMFIATHTDSSWNLGIIAEKAGYYTTHTGYEFYFDDRRRYPSFTLMLKKTGQPIPMYARWVDPEPHAFKKTGRPPIVFNTSIGYDLIAGDWVAPYGKGTNADMLFTEEFNKQSITDYYYKLTISFPNAEDGIQEYLVPDAEKGCALRSPQEAPIDGYQPQLIRESFHHPGQPGKADYDENRIYLFRTTLPDGIHYGKIYGDPEQTPFCYYLNPTPNDRNIEFDPKRNLLMLNRYDLHVTAP
jgi:hypothetical protein